jgi:hypothetical protein
LLSVDIYRQKAIQGFGTNLKGNNRNVNWWQRRGNEKMELGDPLNIPLQKASRKLQLLTKLAKF